MNFPAATAVICAVKKLLILPLLAGLLGSSVSCMTTYDSTGRPVQTVDPAVAVAGVAAAGLIGYASAGRHHHHDRYYGGGGYYRSYRPYY